MEGAIMGRSPQITNDEELTAEEQKRTAERAKEAEKKGKVTNEDGSRDITGEQEQDVKSAQELVQERHMDPETFGQ